MKRLNVRHILPFLMIILLVGACATENPTENEESSSTESSGEVTSSDLGSSTPESSSDFSIDSSDDEKGTSSGESSGEGESSEVESSSSGDSSSEMASSSEDVTPFSEEEALEEYPVLDKAGTPISKSSDAIKGASETVTDGLPTDDISEGVSVDGGGTLEFRLNDEGNRPICRLSGVRLWIKGGASENAEITIHAGSTSATTALEVTDKWQRLFVNFPFGEGEVNGNETDKLSITAGDEMVTVADISLVVLDGEPIFSCPSVLKEIKIESEDDIRTLIGKLTDEEKAAQICMAGWKAETASDWVGQGLGSYLDNDRDVSTFITNYNNYQQDVIDNGGIPPMHSADAVHGHNYMPNAVIFPHNIGMGATRNPALVERVAEVISTELAATGIRWNLSPTVAVARDERWGRMYESFGETPEIVSPLAAAYVRGMQKSGKIAATCKHFVADGGTTGWDQGIAPDDTKYPIDRGDVDLDPAVIKEIHLPPYKASIDAGALSIMAAYNTIQGDKIHGSKYWLTDVLKGELGFKGVLVSDWNGMWLIEEDRYGAVVKGLNAGLDVLMAPFDVFSSNEGSALYDDVLKAIKAGDVSDERIEDALFRQLWVKWKVGLFNDPRAEENAASVIGSATHREIGRQAVRESMVLLKNDKANSGFTPVPVRTLPLKKEGQKIVVGGSHANNAGLQSGGWSIEWQGPNPDNANYAGATTILDGMKEFSNEIVFDETGDNFQDDADIAVIFVGEMPYAEGVGDRPAGELTLDNVEIIPPWDYIKAIKPGDQQALMKRYAEAGIPVVMVLVTGRPLVVTNEIDQAAAFMVAWLPGSEGAGVADVLFGEYKPTGKLPQTWPASVDQIPINEGDGQTPLYELGAGLTF
ncbi:MAG: glycoside hydrolase family 3 protein [Fibrobacterales bacterium]